MAKKARSPKKEAFTAEAALHLFVHLGFVVFFFAFLILAPLWAAIGLVVLEVAQLKYLGACFLTIIAHKRGYMKGKTFWVYVPELLGFDGKKADKIISPGVQLLTVAILVYRIALLFVR